MERLHLLYYVRNHGLTGVCQELINDVKERADGSAFSSKVIKTAWRPRAQYTEQSEVRCVIYSATTRFDIY